MVEPAPPSPPPNAAVVPARPVGTGPDSPTGPLVLPTVPRREGLLGLGLVLPGGLLVPLGFQVIVAFWLRAGSVDSEVDPGASLTPEVMRLVTTQKWLDTLLASALMAYLLWRQHLSPANFGLRRDRPVRQLLWMVGTLAATYAWMVVTVVVLLTIVLLHPALQEDLMQRGEALKRFPAWDYGRMAWLLLPVAVHEEIVFRGLLLPYLRRLVGRWWAAILISTSIFAALHFDQGWLAMVQVFGVGTVFAVFFVLSRSLISVVGAHFIFDFLQFQLIRLLPEA